jgi:hypothetical protein
MTDKIISTLTPHDVFGNPISQDAAIALLQVSPETYGKFLHFPREIQENLIAFLTGQRSITINYDPFFQKIFDPIAHPKRLERMISSILGFDVTIETVLPREGVRLSADSSFVIMDVVVRLTHGAYLAVEIQKVGYDFPGERTACYASDLILRQYNLQRATLGDKFSYNKIHSVYVIVLIENSSAEMKAVAPHYMHNRIVSYDSGAKITELSNICYVSLDTFRNRSQNKIEKPLDAWLTFLSEYEPSAVMNLINQCPEFLDIYQEIAAFRKHPKELINMYSEALAIMDHNMEVMMVERARRELAQTQQELNETNQQLNETNQQLNETNQQLNETNQQLNETNQQLNETNQQLAEAEQEKAAAKQRITELEAQLAEMTAKLAQK